MASSSTQCEERSQKKATNSSKLAEKISHDVLKDCYSDLKIDLNEEITDHQYIKKFISIEEKCDIESNLNSIKRNKRLIDILSTKDNEALEELIEFLRGKGNQKLLVTKLEKSWKAHSGVEYDKETPVGKKLLVEKLEESSEKHSGVESTSAGGRLNPSVLYTYTQNASDSDEETDILC